MLTAQQITYIHPNGEILLENIDLSINKCDKIALIGRNGSGKSTLLKIIAGLIQPSAGRIIYQSRPYYIPQHFGQFNNMTVAGALHVDKKLNALRAILQGNANEENLILLNDDWMIEKRCKEALSYWKISDLSFSQKMEKLSGGEKTKVFLAGILIHQPEIILLDEPTNHLDLFSRKLLYDYIASSSNTLAVVSHDRTLLEFLDPIYDLDKRGLKTYGGNYRFYKKQKDTEVAAAYHTINEKSKAMERADKIKREVLERKQRTNVRGKKKHEERRVPRAYMKKLKDKSDASLARLKESHTEKIAFISKELNQAKQELPDIRKMKMDFNSSGLHQGKILLTAKDINFAYHDQFLWNPALSFQIRSGERINIKGSNGSGKTTLLKIILGEIEPQNGFINRSSVKSIYIDQEYSLINDDLTVYAQAQRFNDHKLPEHEVRIRLNRYLFTKEFWDKPCELLSGGEKMRLTLCSLMISDHAPDLFILDEPVNNLDIQNIEILTSAVRQYAGTLLVVSHDQYFLDEIGITRVLELE